MAVFANSGLGAQLVMLPEATYGVAPTLTSPMAFEFNSETLALKKNIVQGMGLHAGGLFNRGVRRVLTTYSAGGGITMDLPSRALNRLLMQMFGSKSLAAATLVQDGVTGAYSATHAPGSLLGTSMCIQKGVPSVDAASAANPFTYVGQKLTDWEISVATGAIATLALNWTGRNELAGAGNGDPLNGSVPALATFTEPVTDQIFHFREATLYSGGACTTTAGVTSVTGNSAAGNVRSAKVKMAFHLDTGRYFLGSNGFIAEPIENAFRDITGEFVIEWLNSEAMYNAFAADTPTTLQLQFIGPSIGSGSDHSTLTILIPQVYLEGDTPQVGGPAVVTQTVTFTGLDDGANNPIQALYWTLDSV
jgi:hypothetical protein